MVNDLIAVNNLDRRATIYVNQNLRIPLPEDKSILVAKRSNTKKKSAAPSAPASNLVLAKQAARSVADVDPVKRHSAANTNSIPDAGRKHQATKGKTVGAVSGTEPAIQLPPANQMAEFLLAQGAVSEYRPEEQTSAPDNGSTDVQPVLPEQALFSQQQPMALKQTIPESPLKPAILQGHFEVERVSMQLGKSIGHIRVEPEETLGHYAEWLNVSVSEIRRLNGFRYGRPLQLSQKIKIPLDRVTKEDFEVKRFEFHQELSEDFFASYRVEKVLTYSIKRGDNIWTLARQEFEVPLWLIKLYNGDVDFGALIPSQKLLIPVVEKNV